MKKILLIVLVAAGVAKTTGSFAQATNVQDSLALVDLYDSCGGPNWNAKWILTNPVNTWYGVGVTGTRVTTLGCEAFALIGNIPSSLGNLSGLTYLSFYDNSLTGSIPSSLGNLSNLTTLQLDENKLIDTIPSSLGNLSNLQFLSLSDNQLIGSIPASFGNFSKVLSLSVSYNQLTDTIPSSIGNDTALIDLDLTFNQLSGKIPASLGQLSQLEYLSIPNNNLSDSIPTSLGQLKNLTQLELGYNQLSGIIPSSLEELNKLNTLTLDNNYLTFAGMEGIAATYSFAQYTPQAHIPLNYNAGKLSVSAGGTLSNNTYKWYNGGTLVATNVGDSILTVTENGNYSVAVTNAIATKLTLYSDTISTGTFTVKLLSFAATKQGVQNLLKWTTTQEVNSSYFGVERSSDGSNYKAIGQVGAAGNSSAAKNYSLIDTKPVNGMNYYRLKMMDKDGQFSYSPVRTINEAISFAASIYPNPVQSNLSLNFNSDKAETVQVQIVSNEGKVITTQQIQLAAGASTQSINTASLSNGEYYVRLVTEDEETELKFVKER